jgi:PAS domain S-box-containing protein
LDLSVKKLTVPAPLLLHPETTIKEATRQLLRLGLPGAPVCEGDKLLGLYLKTGILEAVAQDRSLESPVKAILSTGPAITSGEQPLSQVWDMLEEMNVVIDQDGNLLGVIYREDLLGYYYRQYQASAEKLTAVLDGAHNGIVAVDTDGCITLFNHTAEKLVGVKAEDVLGRRADRIMPNTGLLATLRSGEPELGQQVELGNHTVFSNRTPILRNGQIVGAVAVFENITALRDALQKLDSTTKMLGDWETIFEHAYDWIVVVDREGRITKISDVYARYLGTTVPAALGKHVTEVIENTRMHIVAKTGKAEIAEVQRIRGRDAIVMRIPLKRDGKVIGAVGKGMFQDVSEVHSLAERLNLLESKLAFYQGELKRFQRCKYSLENIVGDSPAINEAKLLAQKAALSNSTILITAESGTGKELFAQAIHKASPRKDGPFVRVNCAALPKDLLESELFGYEDGAFTGAKKGGKPGKFELAERGTIFLDEIGDLPLDMQAKLLRVLQEREIEKLGSTRLIKVDIRVIAATNRDLVEMVKSSAFREDLFYRLNVFHIPIPPLRERREDIPVLTKFLQEKLSRAMGKDCCQADEAVRELFYRYRWPGNIRELENVLERALNVTDEGIIRVEHLPLYLQEQHLPLSAAAVTGTLAQELDKAEKVILERALQLTNNNKKEAAGILGIHRSGLYRKLQKHNLSEM